jgi:hypothetical protein
LNTGHPKRSVIEFVDVIQSEEYFRLLREKQVSKEDRLAIDEFVAGSMTREEWKKFQDHCLQNQIDPYEEMRELIYSTYARMLKQTLT